MRNIKVDGLKKISTNNMFKKGIFGYELILNLDGCNEKIRSGREIKRYVIELCDLIKMKRFGPCRAYHFGHEKPQTAGYSVVQLIETSSIVGHFSEYWGKTYLNVFSCTWYDAVKVVEFTKQFFGCRKIEARLLVR